MKVALLLVVVSVVTAALYLLRWHNRNSVAPASEEDPASLSAAWASPPLCQRLVNTRKHAPGCFTATAALYPLLVTGLGGSGTHEVASRLRSSGVDVAHEELRPDGAVVRATVCSVPASPSPSCSTPPPTPSASFSPGSTR